MQPGAVQDVSWGDVGGICLYQLDHSGAGDLRGEQRERLREEEVLHGEAGASRLVLGVPCDEALSGLGAGIPAAER